MYNQHARGITVSCIDGSLHKEFKHFLTIFLKLLLLILIIKSIINPLNHIVHVSQTAADKSSIITEYFLLMFSSDKTLILHDNIHFKWLISHFALNKYSEMG